MAYNKQQNPWGVSSSELGWKGFADGGRISTPAAIATPSENPYTKLALKAITDIGGAAWDEYTAPVSKGDVMWGDELSRFDTAIAAQKTPEAIEGAKRAKRDFIRSHPNAGKEIYNRPEWTENIPDFLMPGGSRYKTPEGSLNARQANALRSNWRADPRFTPESAPLAKQKIDPPTVSQENEFPGRIVVDPNDSIPEIAKAKYSNRINQERDAIKQFVKSSEDKGIDAFSNNWGEYWMKKDERRIENIRDSLRDWVQPGSIHGVMSDAERYFSDPKNKGQYEEYKKDPYEWYAKNIEPNKDFSEFSLFGN